MKNYKWEILIGSTLSFMAMYLFYQLMTIKPRTVDPLDKISFEMIRPNSDIVSEFSLDGREVDSRFVNPFVKKDLGGHSDSKHQKLKPPQAKNNKVTATKKTEKPKADEKKKTGISTKFYPADFVSGNTDTIDGNNYNTRPPVNSTPSANAHNNNPKAANAKKEDEKKKRSISEFADLLVDPKTERIGALVTAIKNEEIAAGELQSFIGQMLKSDKSNVQSVGIYLAYYTPGYQGFSVVATNQETLNPEVKTYSEQFLTSFTQPSKLSVLAQALQSSDIKVVVKAGEVIISGLQKIKSGQAIDYSARSNRGNNEVKSASVLGYFLPIAENLKSSQNQTIASIGNALSQQLSQFTATP